MKLWSKHLQNLSLRCVWGFVLLGSSQALASKITELVLPESGDLSRDRVVELLGVGPGSKVSEARLDEGLKRLANTGRYQALQASFDAKTGRLVLEAKLFDVLDNIEFRSPGSEISPELLLLVGRDVGNVTALNRGDRISLDQVGEIRDRVLQRLRERGFASPQVLIALEGREDIPQKSLLISAQLGKQTTVSEIEFHGFRGADLVRIRDMMEETEYVRPYLRKLDVPAELVDRPEDYLLKQFERLRAADAGKPILYKIPFPLDWILINSTLNEWGQRMRSQGYFDFRLQAGVVDGESGGSKLLIRLERGPRYNIQFTGNVIFWERRPREKVLDRPMRLGLPLNLNEAQSQVRSLYLAEGFKDVRVETRTDDRGAERRITFRVFEGQRYYLGDLLWEGLSPREIDTLKEIESEWKSGMAHPFHHTYFDERALKVQLNNLLSMIHAEGFLQARLLGFKSVPRAASDRVDVEVPIQLGPRFTVREVVVEGQHPLSRSHLNRIVNIGPNDIARANRITAIAEALKREVQEEGYLLAAVPATLDEVVTYSDTSDEVDLKYLIDMGPQVRVGQIVVGGIRKTREKVILREFEREDMGPGKLWVPSKVEEIDQRLLSYGLFANQRIVGTGDRVVVRSTESPDGIEVQERDIRVSVSERPGGAIEFGPGYRTDLGVVGFGEYNYRNLWGMNRSVVLRAQVSKKLENFQFFEQKHSLSFLDPYIFVFALSSLAGLCLRVVFALQVYYSHKQTNKQKQKYKWS